MWGKIRLIEHRRQNRLTHGSIQSDRCVVSETWVRRIEQRLRCTPVEADRGRIVRANFRCAVLISEAAAKTILPDRRKGVKDTPLQSGLSGMGDQCNHPVGLLDRRSICRKPPGPCRARRGRDNRPMVSHAESFTVMCMTTSAKRSGLTRHSGRGWVDRRDCVRNGSNSGLSGVPHTGLDNC